MAVFKPVVVVVDRPPEVAASVEVDGTAGLGDPVEVDEV